MTWGAVGAAGIAVGGSLLGGAMGSRGAKKAAQAASDAQVTAARMQDKLGRELYLTQQQQLAPYREAGYTALAGLMDMAGLSRGSFRPPGDTYDTTGGRLTSGTGGRYGNYQAASLQDPNLGEGSDILSNRPKYDWQTDPGYQFRLSEGMRGLENSAAARGGLLSGGFAKAAMGYNQNFASAEYGNVFNRLAGIAGLGQVQNTAVSTTGALGNAAGNNIAGAGMSRASGYMGQANSWANAFNEIGKAAGMYGSSLFGGGGPGGGSVPAGTDFRDTYWGG